MSRPSRLAAAPILLAAALAMPASTPVARADAGAVTAPAVFELLGGPPTRALPAIPPGFATQLVLDDDAAEAAFGVSSAQFGKQFLWFNRFTPVGPVRLQEIWVLFPAQQATAGDAIELVVFQDTDGNPANGATLLWSASSTVQVADGNTFSIYPVAPNLQVLGGGDILIGVVNRWTVSGVDPLLTPATLDASVSQGRSWVAVWNADPPSPVSLPADNLTVVVDTLAPGGNWMIRAFGQGVPIVEVPTLSPLPLALLAAALLLGGLLGLRRARSRGGRATVLGLLAPLALLGATPAAAVTIDSFTTNQAPVLDPPGTTPTVVTGGADIIGTRRAINSDLLAVPLTGLGAGPVSTGVSAGTLNLAVTATTPDSRGEAIVTWDGDASAGNLNVTGLAGQNLTAASHNALRITVNSASAGTELVFDVYTSATAASRGFLRIPVAIAAPTNLFLTYQYDFVPIAASAADFSNVGAIQMRVRGTEVSATIDAIDTIGPTLTASKQDQSTGGVPIAAPILEGSTYKYQMVVSNTGGGLAANVDLNDTVDANTALNAATIRVTPVAIDDSYVTAGHVGRSLVAPGLLANDVDPDTAGSPPELIVAAASVGTFATALGGSITIAADGSFSYEPPVGLGRAVDTFTYTVQDNDAQTATGLVKIAIGPRVWFVDDAHPGTNVGTLNNPFVGFTVGNVNGASGTGDQDAAGDVIFVRTGSHTAAVELEADEWLLGEGEGLTVDGQTIVAAGTDPVLASVGHGIVLATNNTVRGLTIGNTGATFFDVLGSNFGTLTVSNVDLTGAGGALSLTTGALAAAFDTVTSTSGTHGINLDAVSGTLTVNGATTLSDSAFGLRVNASPTLTASFSGTTSLTTSAGTALFAAAGGTLNFSGTSNSAVATNGAAVDLTSTSLGAGATFATVSSTTNASKGINLDAVTGAFTGSGGSVSVSAGGGNAVDVNAGSSNVSYAGSVTSTAGARLAEVTARTGGTVTLSGALSGSGAGHTGINVASNTGGTVAFSNGSKAITSGVNSGVTLASNTGATISFTGGGLVLNSTSGTGFNATGGATAITVQGSGNTITSTTGTALNVSSTTIGASGLTFQSIASNGAANGLVLSSTGASGGLTVTGTGGAGSGGTIQNISGRGASFISAVNISLTNMNFTNTATSAGAPCGSAAVVGANTGCNAAINLQTVSNVTLDRLNITTSGQQGINGIGVTNMALTNSSLSGLGNAPDEDGLHILDLLGTNTVTSTSIASSGDDNVNIQNRTATPSTITFSGGSFNNGVQGSGLLFGIRDTANTTIAISGVTASNNFSGGVVADCFDTATMSVEVSTSTINGNNDAISLSSAGGNTKFNIHDNAGLAALHPVISLLKAAFSVGGTFQGFIQDNTIVVADSQTGDAMTVANRGAGPLTVAIRGNMIDYHGTQAAINIVSGQDGAAVTNATVTDNTIDIKLDGTGNAVNGIFAQTPVASPSGDGSSLCADLGGAGLLKNTFTHSLGGSLAAGDIRVRQRFLSSLRLPGYGGANNDDGAVIAYLNGRNTLVSPATATNNVSGGGSGYSGGGACTQPVFP